MKVGDYVRTEKGISKIITVQDEQVRKIIYTDTKEVFEYYTDYKGNEIKDYWLNYSSNIIDLIEVGDYVNGSKVIDIAQAPKKAVYLDTSGINLTPVTEISSVLTKEQFESNKYKL